jgi:hypothetical protein
MERLRWRPVRSAATRLHSFCQRSAYSVLLSSALEIAREPLPGKTKAEKETLLAAELPGFLTEPLDQLFARANKHRETRHAITKIPTLAPHPAMQPNEYMDYFRDVDAVIRSVICRRLGLETIRIAPS